ncbi:uncharacterized protein LOC111403961 isoform X1 [Olea europaea var. sylvestris]|uniref:uncharacterized protein LOC111403961 isoform X1 n=1 Tax=Olea europaea var. sylvestris TaxID=158386 RepID=UPI000C1CE632|nr:uncharacterized protein LOC111403961 isoform X1 [Olea europaea var. sylvestris]
MILFFKTHHIILLLITIHAISHSKVQALKALFYPRDILPLLPRQVSWPILNTLNNAEDLLPAFVGTATTVENHLQWKGACFYNNSAWLEFHNKSKTEFGGGTLHIKVRNAHSWTCMDLYLFATPYRVTWDYYFLSREHTLEFKEWHSKSEYEYVKNRGISIFLLQAGMLGTLKSLWEVFPLFTNTNWGENSNVAFLKKHMGATFEERPKPWVTNISADDINSGDFLVLSKIRGLWGGFETLEKWVTGSYAGHAAVCLRDSEGKLWVGESGRDNEQGENIIAIMTWEEWWEYELTKDDANPHIALLPLHPHLRAKFNETAAWEYARSMEGLPYGYHNLIFSWIDTISGNYPYPLDAHLVASVMTIWTQFQPAYAVKIWNEALNKRLGTQNLSLSEILVDVEKRGSSFGELLAVPEQDNWVYVDGKSTSCIAFVFEMYKEAGLFGSLSSAIQVTEFTIKDAYTLKFFENNSSRLPKWCNDVDRVKLPFCQIQGRYRMELPGYNTMDPYPHMNERCPSLPPKYSRPTGC